jgi:hypothetical protein
MSCLQSSYLSPLILRIKSILFSLSQLSFNIQYLWVPSHIGIHGSEIADSLAKSSSKLTSPFFSLIPWSNFISLLRFYVLNLWSIYWNNLPINFASTFKSVVPNISNQWRNCGGARGGKCTL